MWKIISWGSHGRIRFCRKLYWSSRVKGVPLKVSSPFIPPWNKSRPVSSRTRIKASAQSFCSMLKHSPVEHLESLPWTPSCSPLDVGSVWPWNKGEQEEGEHQREWTLCLRTMHSQTAMGLYGAHPPSQPSVLQTRLTGKHLPCITPTSTEQFITLGQFFFMVEFK